MDEAPDTDSVAPSIEQSQTQAPTYTNYVSAEEELPHLMDVIMQLVRENAQLRATCRKLIAQHGG